MDSRYRPAGLVRQEDRHAVRHQHRDDHLPIPGPQGVGFNGAAGAARHLHHIVAVHLSYRNPDAIGTLIRIVTITGLFNGPIVVYGTVAIIINTVAHLLIGKKIVITGQNRAIIVTAENAIFAVILIFSVTGQTKFWPVIVYCAVTIIVEAIADLSGGGCYIGAVGTGAIKLAFKNLPLVG